jgi:lysophospholipase L1-like esterase
MSFFARIAGVAAVAAALLAGCTSGPAEPVPARTATTPAPTSTPTPELPAVRSYVAMGDSFTAGPGLADLREGAAFCLRSDRNWPSLLARRLDPRSFADVSCAGATTHDVLHTGNRLGAELPQIAAVKPDTDLVTVGIGGNDGDLFASLISACTAGRGACGSFSRDMTPTILDQTVPDVVDVLQDVRAKAPNATVLLVGYLRIMPDTGSCPTIGIPADDAAAVAAAEETLDRALAVAARQVDVRYVSMRKASRGHDACAGAGAWTNGGEVTDDDGIAFHPRLAGMQAVARAVESELAKR